MAKVALILFSILLGFRAQAEILSSSKNDRFFRIKISADKGLVKISRKSDFISIKTLDLELGSKLKGEFSKFEIQKKFIKDIKSNKNKIENFTEIKINLSDINVEAYNFYRDQEKAYVIDFWNDQDNDALIPKKDIKTAPVTKINKKINKKLLKKEASS